MDGTLDTLNAQIDEVRAGLLRRKRMKSHLSRITADIASRKQMLKELEGVMRKEERDVNNLESVSVRALFANILGNLREQLEIERQEYLMVALKYNECLDMLHILEYEAAVLRPKLDELPSLQDALKDLLQKKSQILKWSGKETGTVLKKLDAQEQEVNIRRIEVDEAILAGQTAQRLLRALMLQLKKVKAWGASEMHGQGRYSAYAKKSFIDKARKTALNAKVALDKLEAEVKDVFRQQYQSTSFDIGRFERFLETFYDHLITDWIVLKSASQVLHHIGGVADKVSRILAMLEAEKLKVKREHRLIERSRKKLLLS